MGRNATESPGRRRNAGRRLSRGSGSTPGKTRHLKEQQRMRPTGVEPATFGLKDRRSLGPRKDPLTTELRAPTGHRTRAAGSERHGE